MTTNTLTTKQQRFVEEYLLDLNATKAAVRAGFSRKTASDIGRQMLQKTPVADRIEAAMAERSARLRIDADKVLQRWWAIANGDARDLIQHRRGACRHCWGIDHEFQWRNKSEFEAELANATVKDVPEPLLPKDTGGYGYSQFAPPHSFCPRCDGVGEGFVFVADVNNLSPKAALLFDGVKKTKDGIEVILVDRMKALDNVARHLGMFNDKLKLQGDAENPLAVLIRELQGSSLQPVANPPD